MADEIEWTPVKVKLGDLSHWADNPVTLTKAQAGKLLRSKEKLGKMQTLAIGPSNGDGKHPLYDGHQRANVWGAAFGMGLEVWALQSSRPLTDEERHAVPIMLRTAVGSLDWDALAGWTDYPLGEWGLDDDALQGLKFDIAALGNLLESESPEPADAEPQIDRAEELNKKWRVKTGDLWRIGEHRLLCGDSTRREDVERVMQGEKAQLVFTDPPYGVGYDGGTKVRKKLSGDTNTDLYSPCCRMAADYSDEKAALYLWHAGIKGIAAAAAAAAAGYEIRCEIVWNKNQAQYGALSAQYKQKHEPCYYCYKRGKSARWYGPTNEITVWDVNRESINEFHPTQKPIELAMRAMRNSSNPGYVVADWFCGSGSTMVACQNLGRKCRAIEISPAYCAVTLERMATAFPGIEIERIE